MDKLVLEIEVSAVKNLGISEAVVLAYVNKIDTIVSNTDIATALGISFPTAQRLLQSLAEDGHILRVGKKFQKLKNN